MLVILHFGRSNLSYWVLFLFHFIKSHFDSQKVYVILIFSYSNLFDLF